MTVTTQRGQVLRDPHGMRLEFTRTYREPIEEVWSAITEPDRTARWFGTWTGDPRSGSVELVMTEDEGATPQTVTILECAAPTSLVVDLPSADGIWRLSVSLRADDGVTTLVFVHRMAEPYDATGIGPGWHYYLDRMEAVVAETDVPDQFDDYFPPLSDAYGLPG